MNIHSSSGIKRTAKDVIGKAKSLQKLGKLILRNQFVTLDTFFKVIIKDKIDLLMQFWFLVCFFSHFLDPHQKDDINKKAFDKFKKEHGVAPQADSAAPSERFEGEVCSSEQRKLIVIPGHRKV